MSETQKQDLLTRINELQEQLTTFANHTRASMIRLAVVMTGVSLYALALTCYLFYFKV